MTVILQSWCQILHAFSGLRYVNSGLGHIQCIYISAYSNFNIYLNVPALLLKVFRQFNERYTAILVANTAYVLRFTLCQLWSRTYTVELQIRTFRLQYSSERICDAIGDIPIFRCALFCKFGVKYRAHLPVYAM
jgi:hypothetical protein